MTTLGLDDVLDLVDDVAARQAARRALQAADERLAAGLQLARLHHRVSARELGRLTGLPRREVARLLRAGSLSAF